MRWLLLLLLACSDDWKAPVAEHAWLVCRFEATCAASVQGLDCEAYRDQYVARADPCTNYDDYYVDACLTQLREIVDIVETDPADCPVDVDAGAPACTQAFIAVRGGGCPDW